MNRAPRTIGLPDLQLEAPCLSALVTGILNCELQTVKCQRLAKVNFRS